MNILGSAPESWDRKKLYGLITDICRNYIAEVKSPLDEEAPRLEDNDLHKDILNTIKEADLVISELSEESTRQGIELKEASRLRKSILIIANRKSNLSDVVKGLPGVKDIIYYDDDYDLKLKLPKFLLEQTI